MNYYTPSVQLIYNTQSNSQLSNVRLTAAVIYRGITSDGLLTTGRIFSVFFLS